MKNEIHLLFNLELWHHHLLANDIIIILGRCQELSMRWCPEMCCDWQRWSSVISSSWSPLRNGNMPHFWFARWRWCHRHCLSDYNNMISSPRPAGSDAYPLRRHHTQTTHRDLAGLSSSSRVKGQMYKSDVTVASFSSPDGNTELLYETLLPNSWQQHQRTGGGRTGGRCSEQDKYTLYLSSIKS